MADDHNVNRTGLFTTVFIALVILTGISFWVANSSLMDQPARGWMAMMLISVAKALLVIIFFMHLKWETSWKFVLTIPAAVMATLLALILVPDIGNRTQSYSNDRQKFAAFELPKVEDELLKTTKQNANAENVKQPSANQTGNNTKNESENNADKYKDAEGEWGTFKGQFVVTGDVPVPAEIVPDRDKEACELPMYARELIVDKATGGLKNVVVMLVKPKEKLAIHPYYADKLKGPAFIDNKLCRFEPHIALLLTSQTLRVKNSDQVGHNANISSFHDPNSSNKSIPAGGFVDLKLPEVEARPINVECTSHTWMKGYVLVRDEPYMAVSNSKGEFEIKYFPAGDWEIQFWHERTGYLLAKIDGKEITEGRKKIAKIKIEDEQTFDLGKIDIDLQQLIK